MQEKLLKDFMPKTSEWEIPQEQKDTSSTTITTEKIKITDIESLIKLQLENPEIAANLITKYDDNGGRISHPSHADAWNDLYKYDMARNCKPLCLKVRGLDRRLDMFKKCSTLICDMLFSFSFISMTTKAFISRKRSRPVCM
jgi:hypothetical protein